MGTMVLVNYYIGVGISSFVTEFAEEKPDSFAELHSWVNMLHDFFCGLRKLYNPRRRYS